MKIRCSFFLGYILILLLGCDSSEEMQWYKGNLHTHSYWSDGDDFPEMIMDWYKANNYHFAVLSDHNILQEGEKWIAVPEGSIYARAFDEYVERFGDHWVEHKRDQERGLTVRLKTLGEYKPLLEEEGKFLIIKSEEITDRFEDKHIHLNATNLKELIEPQGGQSVADVLQRNIDKVYQQREETGVPMFPHINHPNFTTALTPEDFKQITGDRFFEVYNGHPYVFNEGGDTVVSTEELWDEVLTHYVMHGKPLLYGLATDDAHNYHEYSSSRSNPGRGWVVVKAPELTPAAIVESMEAGAFYASTGVELVAFDFSDGEFSMKIKEEGGVEYTTRFIGTLSSTPDAIGEVLAEEEGTEPSYRLKGNELYIRATVVSTKVKSNPYKEGEVEKAWLQPVTGNPVSASVN